MPHHPSKALGRRGRLIHVTAGAALLVLSAGCGDADAGALRLTDADSASPGATAMSQALAEDVTSDDYRKWLVAQQALDRLPDLELPSQVSLRKFDEADVDRVEDYLASNELARSAIEGAGLSVKDYVRTSVALERSMALAQGEVPAPTADSTLLRAPLPGEDDPTFQRVWAGRRLRVVEADAGAPADRRWRNDDDSESRRSAKRFEKERKREAKARAKHKRHGHRGKH